MWDLLSNEQNKENKIQLIMFKIDIINCVFIEKLLKFCKIKSR